ncbi:MAG: hypothetical protein CL607_10905 [Anaerolineaceae bacterium]|nr:hypothetical protein [Anaerolineaceae bacterium]
MSRLMGALIILRTLALPVLVVVTFLVVQAMVSDVLQKTEQRRMLITTELSQIEDDMTVLAGTVGSAQETVNGSFGRLARFLDQIDFDELPLPDFTVPTTLSLDVPEFLEDGLKAIPVPGTSYNLLQVIQNWTKVTVPFADDINGIPLAIENAFGEFEDAFGAFATMASRMNSTLDSMQVANAQTVALVDDIHIILQGGTGKQPGTPWLTILRTLLITLGVFVAIWYITSAYDDLRHGWRMMTGQA